ncbi:MAG TPA: efflux RND transporter periplasmic adaptor subunit [Thermoanaerobaculia bacterium]|jgi:HlyD family secretion protein|nr:efflux RND transporter periplasmic adaptor subunit [Thermoanaerobaculia bacterium]
MSRLGKTLVLLIILAAASVGVYAFARNGKSKDGGLKEVEVTQGTIVEKAVAVGQIQPRQKFQVKSKISGIVRRALVQVGDTVKAGDPLFEIAPDPTPLEVSEVDRRVESATASFRRAESEFQRSNDLAASGVLPRSDVDQKREAYELARVALFKAQQDRDLTRKGRLGVGGQESIIRAPAAGTVLTRMVNEGDPIVPLTSYQPGTEMATIADMSDLIFKGTVDEIDVGKLSGSMVARIKVGALPTDIVTGHVQRIAPQAQQKEGATLFDVEIELDPNQKITLRAGYSANADVIIREKKDVLVLPERLVSFEDGGKKASVEVPNADPKAEPKKVEIKTGISDGLNVEIVSGLKKGEKVVERPPKEIS